MATAAVTPFSADSLVSEGTGTIVDLIRQARAGDGGAMQQLLVRYREFVRLVVRCRAGGRLQARVDHSDLVQETFVRVVENFAQFHGTEEAEWRAWLGRIADHEAVRQLRRHVGAEKRAVGKERCIAAAGPSSTGSPRLDDWLAKTSTTPSRLALRKERAAILADALARLPEDYREVLVLRHLQELDFPEVAEKMGRSPGAVRVLWVRALKKLREQLQADLDSFNG